MITTACEDFDFVLFSFFFFPHVYLETIYGLHESSMYQMTALVLEMFLFLFGAMCDDW